MIVPAINLQTVTFRCRSILLSLLSTELRGEYPGLNEHRYWKHLKAFQSRNCHNGHCHGIIYIWWMSRMSIVFKFRWWIWEKYIEFIYPLKNRWWIYPSDVYHLYPLKTSEGYRDIWGAIIPEFQEPGQSSHSLFLFKYSNSPPRSK